MSNPTRPSPFKLSRRIGDRVLLGALAFTLAIPSGLLCWNSFFQSRPTAGVFEIIAQFLVHDAFLAVFILCVLALVWAVAAPRSMERLLERRAVAAYFAVIVSVLTVFIFLWIA
jgi:hypothetical protein